MKKSIAILCALVLVLGLALTGCGSTTETATTATATTEATATETTEATEATETAEETVEVIGKAACILGVGGLGDQSFNDLAYAGLVRAEEELGIEFDYAEPMQLSDFEPIMRDMASSGEYGVIVCIGYDCLDPLIAVAPDFPDQKFAIIDSEAESDNVANYMFKEEEGSFLVGALAGLMEKNPEAYGLEGTNTIGFVGAVEVPLIVKFNAGYQAGAMYVNSDITALTDYVSGSDPYSDTTTAKEISLSQNNKGAEIVFHAAGGAGLGVFQGASEGGFYAIGCNSNQNHLDPDAIIASMIKRVDSATYEIVKAAIITDDLPMGETTIMGLANDGCDYSVELSNMGYADEDIAIVEELKAKIAAGELVIPQTMEEVEGFLAANTFEG